MHACVHATLVQIPGRQGGVAGSGAAWPLGPRGCGNWRGMRPRVRSWRLSGACECEFASSHRDHGNSWSQGQQAKAVVHWDTSLRQPHAARTASVLSARDGVCAEACVQHVCAVWPARSACLACGRCGHHACAPGHCAKQTSSSDMSAEPGATHNRNVSICPCVQRGCSGRSVPCYRSMPMMRRGAPTHAVHAPERSRCRRRTPSCVHAASRHRPPPAPGSPLRGHQ